MEILGKRKAIQTKRPAKSSLGKENVLQETPTKTPAAKKRASLAEILNYDPLTTTIDVNDGFHHVRPTTPVISSRNVIAVNPVPANVNSRSPSPALTPSFTPFQVSNRSNGNDTQWNATATPSTTISLATSTANVPPNASHRRIPPLITHVSNITNVSSVVAPTTGISPEPINTPVNNGQTKNSAFSTDNGGTTCVTSNSTQVTPVATLRKRQSPLSNVSTVTFQTPVVRQVNQRPRRPQTSGLTNTIPTLSTQKSIYETGESLRKTKKSKRPTLQSRSPIVFDLDDDGHVRKMYDNGSASASFGRSNSKNPIDQNIINEVKDVSDESSDLVKKFRRARDRYTENNEQNIRIKLVAKRGKDGRQYTLPTANEVDGLIVGDLDCCAEDRDIVIEKFGEGLQRINIFHPMYLPLQYPLLMPCAQDGYYLGIPHRKTSGKQTTRNTSEQHDDEKKEKIVSMREWFAYQIQDRPNKENLFVRGGRLFQ
ncbi:hypothetical protein CTI12_AA089430 [Artemisia annua]|uniref:Helitron helicase-like domain-containing protein n=1 Tax=Artemisia annua TaxID=35608 RepID=A0A2U1PYR4_ARTAN|nr:hypothetical protein CTI12_AA089430 [Artemisia annua]